jgi:hypothetical protein
MAANETWSDAKIRALKPKEARYEKSIVKGGLRIRVTPNNVKTWIYRYKIDGKTEKLTIGHYPNMSLHDANVRFLELSNQRREGDNPKSNGTTLRRSNFVSI